MPTQPRVRYHVVIAFYFSVSPEKIKMMRNACTSSEKTRYVNKMGSYDMDSSTTKNVTFTVYNELSGPYRH